VPAPGRIKHRAVVSVNHGQRLVQLFFPQTPSSAYVRYGFATATCIAAFVARLLLDPVLQEHSPLLLFALAVAASAIRGGFGTGVLATLLGAFGALYFFPPMGSFFPLSAAYVPTGIFQLLVFFVVGAILSWLGGELRRLRWNAVELADQRNEILTSITDGFLALDYDYHFVYFNKFAKQLAQNRDGILGKTIWELIPGLKWTLVEWKFREAMSRRVPVHFEHLFPPSNQWLEFQVYPARNGGITIYFRDISDRKMADLRLYDALGQRDAALENVRLLSGLLPICASCKKIRDDQGKWQQMEVYISAHSQAKFSHGLCPDCAKHYMDDLQSSKPPER
jgi:PAS domain S-box-containing protein